MPRRRPRPMVTRMQIGVMNFHGGGAWAVWSDALEAPQVGWSPLAVSSPADVDEATSAPV